MSWVTVALQVVSSGLHLGGSECWKWDAGEKAITVRGSSPEKGPSGRCCHVAWQVDDAAYIFGGSGYTSHSKSPDDVSYLGDLWQLNLTTLAWKHLAGSLAPNSASPDAPSARNYALVWHQAGALWLWGGFGSAYDGDKNGRYLDDLWRFSLEQGRWTRIKPQGVTPPPRDWANAWSDGSGDAFIGGGIAPCPPLPEISISNREIPAITGPDFTLIAPTGLVFHKCKPIETSGRGFSKTPSSTIAFAPSPISSAG